MKKTLFIFYILVAYVFMQFGWWLYLIIDLNKEIYHINSHNLPENWLNRKIWMTIGEGAVFFGLLLIGSYFTHYFLKKQLRLIQQQKNFLLSITHELKTPVTSLQMTLENLQNPKLSHIQKQQMIHNGLCSINRLESLINNLIYSAKADSQNFKISLEPQNISEFITQELKTLNNNRIISEIQSGIITSFSPDALKIVLYNLIDNALKYSSKPITVRLYRTPQTAVLEIRDLGNGIPENEKKLIFQKFYRIGNEETRQNQGTGIGLYLAKKFAEIQKAKISVKNNSPKGSIFAVEFQLIKNV